MAASSKLSSGLNETLGSDARGFSFALEENDGRLELRALHRPDYGSIHADWSSADVRRRISAGKKQLLARAIGLHKHPAPRVLDATAGLGRDGFTLAALGAGVTLLERHPQTAALLRDAHRRALADPKLAVTTCPYRAVPGASFWSKLEAIGMNTEFLGGVLVARMLNGMDFALGPTIAARRDAIDAVGGWTYLQEFLAEDFVLGNEAAAKGLGVGLSSYVIEHRIGAQSLRKNFAHRLRWCRSTRRSRPAGYVGQLFTNPLPIALALWAVLPATWPALVGTTILRAIAGHATAETVLHDPLCRRQWCLVPLQDLLSFAVWAAGFFGNTIDWRGETYRLEKDGRFTARREK